MSNQTADRIEGVAAAIAREQAIELETMAAKSTDGEATLTIKIALKRQGEERTITGAYKVSYTEAVKGDIEAMTFDPRQTRMGV